MKIGRSSKRSRPLNSEGKPRDNSVSLNSKRRLKPSKRSLKRQKPPVPLHKGQQRSLFPRPQERQENSPLVISCHYDSEMRLRRGHHTLITRPRGCQENAVNPALANALVDPDEVEPQGVDEEEDLAPMPDLQEYARILQCLGIEQEQDRINQLHQNQEPKILENLQASPPVTPGNEESSWIDDPLTLEMSLIPNCPLWRHLLSKLPAIVQIDPGSVLNLISTTALEELSIPPSKPSHTFVSIFGYDGSAQRPIGKIRFRLQIGDLISEVTVYAIKTPSCYNILLGRPWIHENGVVPSTLHQCIKFVSDDGLIHRVFVDKKPFKGKEVHFADFQMYKDEKEKEEEKITSFAGNLQKDKGKAPQQSLEENKPSDKFEENNPSPFVVSFKSSRPLVITTKAKKTKQKIRGKFDVSFVSII
ncbi:hypothetical protein MRB53_020974 [Persea americana]|uniref:Uncharacterized protein n=1 Tax=Persea americana TaxID=3435 RepID=A0ACC2L2S7_PERAE|nr:hypothetical protein MRB53_020974 [Persea americana]